VFKVIQGEDKEEKYNKTTCATICGDVVRDHRVGLECDLETKNALSVVGFGLEIYGLFYACSLVCHSRRGTRKFETYLLKDGRICLRSTY